jgi:rubrerythrin
MDVSMYGLEDLVLTALKSEIEARDTYSKLAGGVKNFVLKERLSFLAGEEEKHRQFFERLFHKVYLDKELVVPEGESPVPLPQLQIDTENMPLSEVLESAMAAESAAHDFYIGLADRFEDQPEIKKMLLFIASMEMGHYKILGIEKENAEKFEDYDSEWPMMHVGP